MGLDSDEYHHCKKVRGEKTIKLHDKIKQQYENGVYDQQINTTTNYSNPDKLG